MSTLQVMYERTDRPELRNRIGTLLTLGWSAGPEQQMRRIAGTYRASGSGGAVYRLYRIPHATQRYMRWRLEEAGISAVWFDG